LGGQDRYIFFGRYYCNALLLAGIGAWTGVWSIVLFLNLEATVVGKLLVPWPHRHEGDPGAMLKAEIGESYHESTSSSHPPVALFENV
jgi:hypothetical protein